MIYKRATNKLRAAGINDQARLARLDLQLKVLRGINADLLAALQALLACKWVNETASVAVDQARIAIAKATERGRP